MGLLDDAIREHLELKRRHGADPDEVTRQEREALGAPVRGEFAKPDAEQGVAAEGPDDAGAEPETEVAEVPEISEPPEMPGEPEPEPSEPVVAEPEPQAGTEEDPWLVEDPADPEPQPREPEPPGDRPAAIAASAGAEPPEPGEDVLEETPEFLQETPEHERLWFEQKPPRGFDWDK